MLLFALCCLQVWATFPVWWMALKNSRDKTFDYADSLNPRLVAYAGFSDSETSPLVMFIKRYVEHWHFEVNGVLVWNDQEEDEPNVVRARRAEPSAKAHSKGILLVDENGGSLLTHSSPKFPANGHFLAAYPENAVRNAQHFFCVNLTRYQVNEFLDEVLTKIHPAVQQIFLSTTLAAYYPTLNDIAHRVKSVWKTGYVFTKVDFLLPNGVTLSMVVKPRNKIGSIFEYIATQEVRGTILAQTWVRSRDAYERPTHDVRKVCQLQNNLRNRTWWTTSDHSKYFVAQGNNIVGVGDLNRQYSQWTRGGIFFLLPNQDLAQSFRSRVVLYNMTCAEEDHQCSNHLERDPNKDNDICESTTCKCTDDNCCKPKAGTSTPSSACAPVFSSCAIKRNRNRRSARRGICVDTPRGSECVIEGIWSDWDTGDCSVPCGGGTQIQMRHCRGICRGENKKTVECNAANCDDCALTRANDFKLLGTDAPLVSWCNGAGRCGSYDSLSVDGCGGCPPSADNNFICMNDEQCATSDCCRTRGGISRCPTDQPFMCAWKMCGASPDYCCVPTSARCADKGGVLRSCPFCVDKFVGHIQCGDTCNNDAIQALCPRTCDLCSCLDNDAGLQTEAYMGCFTCDYAKDRCSSDVVKSHCPRTCNMCGLHEDRDELRLKRNVVEKCPAFGSNCAKVSSSSTPCAVAVSIEELHSIGWWNDRIDTVWVRDECILRLYEHVDFGGKSAEFQAGAHELASWSGVVSSIKCDCGICSAGPRGKPPGNCPQVCGKVRITDMKFNQAPIYLQSIDDLVNGASLGKINPNVKFYVNDQVDEEAWLRQDKNYFPLGWGTYEVHNSGDAIVIVCAETNDHLDHFIGHYTLYPTSFSPVSIVVNKFGYDADTLPSEIHDNYFADSMAHSDTNFEFTYECLSLAAPCPVNHFVWNHRCHPCMPDTSKPAGDDATGENTRCIATSCAGLYAEACLFSQDGRIEFKNSPCIYCCGRECTDNHNKCEPLKWLQSSSSWDGQGASVNGVNTCIPPRTIYGKLCGGICDNVDTDYYWCVIDGSWDYCSLNDFTMYGKKCRDACERRTENYYWCNDDSSWDYCSPGML